MEKNYSPQKSPNKEIKPCVITYNIHGITTTRAAEVDKHLESIGKQCTSDIDSAMKKIFDTQSEQMTRINELTELNRSELFSQRNNRKALKINDENQEKRERLTTKIKELYETNKKNDEALNHAITNQQNNAARFLQRKFCKIINPKKQRFGYDASILSADIVDGITTTLAIQNPKKRLDYLDQIIADVGDHYALSVQELRQEERYPIVKKRSDGTRYYPDTLANDSVAQEKIQFLMEQKSLGIQRQHLGLLIKKHLAYKQAVLFLLTHENKTVKEVQSAHLILQQQLSQAYQQRVEACKQAALKVQQAQKIEEQRTAQQEKKLAEEQKKQTLAREQAELRAQQDKKNAEKKEAQRTAHQAVKEAQEQEVIAQKEAAKQRQRDKAAADNKNSSAKKSHKKTQAEQNAEFEAALATFPVETQNAVPVIETVQHQNQSFDAQEYNEWLTAKNKAIDEITTTIHNNHRKKATKSKPYKKELAQANIKKALEKKFTQDTKIIATLLDYHNNLQLNNPHVGKIMQKIIAMSQESSYIAKKIKWLLASDCCLYTSIKNRYTAIQDILDEPYIVKRHMHDADIDAACRKRYLHDKAQEFNKSMPQEFNSIHTCHGILDIRTIICPTTTLDDYATQTSLSQEMLDQVGHIIQAIIKPINKNLSICQTTPTITKIGWQDVLLNTFSDISVAPFLMDLFVHAGIPFSRKTLQDITKHAYDMLSDYPTIQTDVHVQNIIKIELLTRLRNEQELEKYPLNDTQIIDLAKIYICFAQAALVDTNQTSLCHNSLRHDEAILK